MPMADIALGAGDCEEWRPDWLLHQPVNALSSLAYAAAGAWIATRPGTDRASRVSGAVYAGAVISNAVGSFLYHGPGWPGSVFVHDAAIPAAVLFITADDVALLRGWTVRRQLTAYAAALGAACLVIAVAPASGVTVAWISGATAAAAEVALARHTHQVSARAALATAGILVGAVLAVLAGRTDSPLCRPHSPLQGHALWHVLTAVAMAQWDRVRRTRRAGQL
jgi:hypothetical protein